MLYHLKMAQIGFGNDQRFTGTGTVTYTYTAEHASSFAHAVRNQYATVKLRHDTNASAILDLNADKIHISFTLPKQFIDNAFGRTPGLAYISDHIMNDLEFEVTTPLMLNYDTDLNELSEITLHGIYANGVGAIVPDMDTVWRVNGVEYGGYFDSYTNDDSVDIDVESVVEDMVSMSSITFRFDQQSLDRLAVWLDYVYENHTTSARPKESPDALPHENGTTES